MLTSCDREILALAAEHPFVLADQVRLVVGLGKQEALERLDALEAAELLQRYRVSPGGPSCFRITRAGSSTIGSGSAPKVDWRYRHCVGVVWLWLAARGGTFGEVDRIVSEHEMRATDSGLSGVDHAIEHAGLSAPATSLQEPEFGVPAGNGGRNATLHYPDLLLVTNAGRIPVELLLVAPAPRRLDAVLRGYGADPRVAAALYLTADPAIGWMVQCAAARVELSPMVQVQPIALAK